MNSLKKLLLTTAIVTGSLAFAQHTVMINDLPTTYNQSYEFRGSWNIKSDDMNNAYIINGSQIMNNNASRSNDLELTVHFVPTQSVYSIKNLPNNLGKVTSLGQIDGNRSSFNNVRIQFSQTEIDHLEPGVYNTVIVLKEKKNGNIINYKILNDTFRLVDNQLRLVDETSTNYLLNGEKVDNTLSNVYSTVKSSLSLGYTPNLIVLSGDWKLDVDFATLNVNITGENNAIQNRTSKDTNNLKLLVYFSENPAEEYKTVEGYELLNVDIKPISASSELRNPKISTNITKPIPSGEYYPLLVLTELNEEGEYKVKSVIRFKDPYQF